MPRRKQNNGKVARAPAQAKKKLAMPQRTWKVEKASAADNLLRAQGLRGTDVRSPDGGTAAAVKQSLVLIGSNQVTPSIVDYNDRAVSYLAMGIVLKAIKSGFKANFNGLENVNICPYYAFRYLIDIIKQAMAGSIPQLQTAPRWLWHLLFAVKAKTCNFKTAKIKYSWNELSSGLPDSVNFVLGTAGNSYSVFWGVLDGSGNTVDGFPVLATPPNWDPVGLPNQGPDSLNVMFSYLTGPQSELISQPSDSTFDNDSSAFCAVYPEIGESFFSQGGLKDSCYSERNIDSPILAKFGVYQERNWRGWQKLMVTGGSSTYLGGRINELQADEWRNKTPPTFKFYNFDEFFEVLSLTMCLALERASVLGVTVPTLDMTSQEVQLLLRQNLVPFFSNELAQDLRLIGPNFMDMLPFVVGPNGSSVGRVSMNVPTFFAENVRCVTRITHHLKSPRGKASRQIIDIIPILGRSTEKAPLGNYVWGESNTPLYLVDPAEVPVSLIDCSAIVGQNTAYLDLNTDALSVLSNKWNTFISKLTSVLSSLVSLTPSPGVHALQTGIYTNVIRDIESPPPPAPNVPVAGRPMQKKSSKKNLAVGRAVERHRLGAEPAPGSSYFDQEGDVQITGALGFNSALAPYIQMWVLPVLWIQEPGGTAQPQAYRVFQVEPTFVERSDAQAQGSASPNDLPRLLERHRNMAAIDVKAQISDGDHELIAGLKEMARAGEGGFFTSIASMIGDAVGIPGVRTIANEIGKITGL